MKKHLLVLSALCLGLLLNSSCNDPSSIGADLLAEDQADTEYTDTITIRTSTVKEDSILVYDPDPQIEFNNFLVSDLMDPVFGSLKTGIYAQLWLGFDPPDYEDAILDSVVLTLKYDSLNTYGDILTEPAGIGVYRLQENIPTNEELYSHQTYTFDEASPLFEDQGFTPKLSTNDSLLNIIRYTSQGTADTVNLAPHLRVHLPLEFGQELIEYDSAAYASVTNFLELFNGIHVKALNTTKGVVSFDLSDAISGLTVYYRQDTLIKQYQYPFSTSGVKLTSIAHDFNGSVVDGFFGDAGKGDSLVFMQSMAGPNIKVEIPYAASLDNLIVNKAELEFTYAILDEDDPDVFDPLERMVIVRRENAEDPFLFISDVLIGGSAFGGIVEEKDVGAGNILHTYNLNISAHFQEIVDGSVESTLFLRSFPKQENARRAVLFGPGHALYPAKLILTYTKLNP